MSLWSIKYDKVHSGVPVDKTWQIINASRLSASWCPTACSCGPFFFLASDPKTSWDSPLVLDGLDWLIVQYNLMTKKQLHWQKKHSIFQPFFIDFKLEEYIQTFRPVKMTFDMGQNKKKTKNWFFFQLNFGLVEQLDIFMGVTNKVYFMILKWELYDWIKAPPIARDASLQAEKRDLGRR